VCSSNVEYSLFVSSQEIWITWHYGAWNLNDLLYFYGVIKFFLANRACQWTTVTAWIRWYQSFDTGCHACRFPWDCSGSICIHEDTLLPTYMFVHVGTSDIKICFTISTAFKRFTAQ
jgi:hypothetical protein